MRSGVGRTLAYDWMARRSSRGKQQVTRLLVSMFISEIKFGFLYRNLRLVKNATRVIGWRQFEMYEELESGNAHCRLMHCL
ncbi:hypothetical protein RR46_02448 [Papilio xuthus]|uniref:Uncharacterized protein n=1 Tax=Papilio xuthus TaxID=66420 RepID=A0A194QMN9_PAPXU|nr:hypothetical protein RR46_02448 [Papilio xuthus]